MELIDSLLADTNVWVTIAFFIFLFIGIKFAKTPVLGALDERTQKIHDEIAQAEALKNEAQELLSEYQKKHRDAMNEAEQIVENAKEKASLLQTAKEKELQDYISKRKEQACLKIERAEQLAVEEIQNTIIDLAVNATSNLLKQTNDGKKGKETVNASIENLKSIA